MPPNRAMIFGMLRHDVFDIFNKNEEDLVSSINAKISDSEIKRVYDELIDNIAKEHFMLNQDMAEKFEISSQEFFKSVKESANPEIKLRVDAVAKTLAQGFLGEELWKNLSPKFLSEFKLESPELGLRGRVDRIKIDSEIMPYEIKTRNQIYESDKIQLAGYALLLEKEFSKKIEKGAIEVLGKTEEVLLDEHLKNKVLEIAEKIRNIDENAQMPSSFSKCQSCQFNQECQDTV